MFSIKFNIVLTFIVVLLFQTEAYKIGQCSRRLVKRHLCDCAPTGTDQCDDECSNDVECPGVQKCCANECRKECQVPEFRAPQPEVCPQGEEYDACGPNEEATCDRPVPTRTLCVSGCTCPPDSVRNAAGRCITGRQCPQAPAPVCTVRHEIYSTCHRTCQATCSNPTAEGCSQRHCVSGCQCAQGYVRSGSGQCILPCHCPKRRRQNNQGRCGSNQESVSCGSICSQNCQNGFGSQSCPSSCRQRCCRRRRLL
jgi:hypothetical protein